MFCSASLRSSAQFALLSLRSSTTTVSSAARRLLPRSTFRQQILRWPARSSRACVRVGSVRPLEAPGAPIPRTAGPPLETPGAPFMRTGSTRARVRRGRCATLRICCRNVERGSKRSAAELTVVVLDRRESNANRAELRSEAEQNTKSPSGTAQRSEHTKQVPRRSGTSGWRGARRVGSARARSRAA